MSEASQDMYRNHCAEALRGTGMDPEQAKREAARRYPPAVWPIRKEDRASRRGRGTR